MKKKLFYSAFSLGLLCLLAHSPAIEARHHTNTRVQVNLGASAPQYNRYVVSRPAYVAVQPQYYVQPGPYGAPVYVAAPQPVYVEQVYVMPAPRPAIFPGLSFSWNFFR